MRYRSGMPLVLKGLDVAVTPEQKVGVVGRTGAGKFRASQISDKRLSIIRPHMLL